MASCLLLALLLLPASAVQEAGRRDLPPPEEEAGRPLSGRALFPDNAPVPDLLVVALDASGAVAARARTDDRGVFRFPELPPGDYHLLPRRPGIREETVATTGRAGESGLVLVVDGWRLRPRLRSRVPLPETARISFQTLDPALLPRLGIGRPAPGDFERFCRRSLLLAAADATRDGLWSLDPVWIRARARVPGFLPAEDILLLGSGPRDETLELVLTPRLDAGRLRLRLQGPEDLPVLPPCRLHLLPVLDGPQAAWEEALCPPDGISPPLPPGRYRLDVTVATADAGTWLPWAGVEAVVPAGGEAILELELRRGGRLVVEVLLRDWPGPATAAPRPWLVLTPLEGQVAPRPLRQQVEALPGPEPAAPPRPGEPPPPLRFRVRLAHALPPGAWQIRARAGPLASPWVRVELAAGKTSTITLELGPRP